MAETEILSREQAYEKVSQQLHGEPEPKEEAQTAEVTETQETAEPAEAETQEEQPSTETHEDESQEQTQETEDTEEEHLPSNWNELAEAYGKSPEELAAEFRITRKVNGHAEEVTLAEALRDHQLSADYSQKTAELAESKREFNAQKQQFESQMTEHMAQLSDRITALDGAINYEIEPEQFVDHETGEFDHLSYIRAKEQKDGLRGMLEQARAERENLFHYHTQQQQEAVDAYRKEQQQLLSMKIPEFASPEKAEAVKGEIKQALTQHYGFGPEEVTGWLNGPADHRYVQIARDAAAYRKMKSEQSTTTKKLSAKPKVVKPGASAPREKSDETKRKDLRAQLRKTRGKRDQKLLAEDIVKNALGR